MLATSADVLSLLNILSEAIVCPGHPDSHFLDFIKSQKGMKLNSSSNNILATPLDVKILKQYALLDVNYLSSQVNVLSV